VKRTKKALCVGALAAAAALGTAGTAVAAPAPAAQNGVVALRGSGHIASRAGTAVPNVNPVVFSCSYLSLVPFQSFQFNCTVQSGRLQLYLICTNGSRVYSPIMPAIGSYYPVLTCPGSSTVSTINWQAV
jgi:hypothetical protein